MQFVKVGYYDDRNRARVPIDKGALQSCFQRRPQRLRVEVLDGYVVLTDPQDAQWRSRND